MADFGLTESSATNLELVSQLIQAELIQRSILMPLVQNFDAPNGMDVINIPRAGSFSTSDKSENTSLTAATITYAVDPLLMNKHKAILLRLEDIAQIQATPDIVRDMIERMGRALALQIDTDIFACLEATSAAAPDHRVAYVGASIAKADILVARELLHIQNVPFNECIIGVSPGSESDLLGIADFVQAQLYGNADGLVKGQLGTLYGAKVVMSNVFSDLKTIVWHPSHVALGVQKQINFEQQRDLPNVASVYLASAIYGCKTLDSGKRGVMLGTAA